jgi:hypothetical protein
MTNFLVMDTGRTVRVEIEAPSPQRARETAKRQLSGWVGDLEVYVKEDPLKGNRPATEEFFGARPPIIL